MSAQAAPDTDVAGGRDQGFGRHVPQLDAVRGIACMMVLLAHLKAVGGLGWMPPILGPAGVGIFFALSGFLITRGLVSGDRDLLGFYNRRAGRILPPYILTVLVLVLLWPGKELYWAATFSFNLLYVSGQQEYFHVNAGAAPIPPIGHFWSLCVEEHFYWLWPMLVVALSVRRAQLCALAVVLLTPLIAYIAADALAARDYQPAAIDGLLSRMTLTQLTAIAIGCLVAIHEARLARAVRLWRLSIPVLAPLSLAALAGAAILVLVWPDRVYLKPTALHLGCAGIFGLGMCCAPLGLVRPLRSVGRISYGLYLYHLPIYAGLGLAHGASARWPAGLLALSCTFLVAIMSWRFVESPAIEFVRRRQSPKAIAPARPLVGSIVSAAFVVACIACIAHVTAMGKTPAAALLGLTPALQEEMRRVSLPPTGTAVSAYRWLGVVHVADERGFRRNTPFPAKKPGATRVLTLGDSYTWGACVEPEQTYSAALEQLLRQAGAEVEVLNCGRSGGQAEDILQTLREIRQPLQADLVVYGITMSDFLPAGESFGSHTLQEWYEPQHSERFVAAIRNMKAECNTAGIPLVAFVFSERPAAEGETAAYVESLCRKAGVDVVSAEDYRFRYRAVDFRIAPRWDWHPTAECHAIHARILSKHLEPLVIRR
jgi:peptidoglycan/LPS O-acetylase OafA/YrhL